MGPSEGGLDLALVVGTSGTQFHAPLHPSSFAAFLVWILNPQLGPILDVFVIVQGKPRRS